MIKLRIDGVEAIVEQGSTVLEAAKAVNIHIPTLCHLEGICRDGVCRVCVVKIAGKNTLQTACNTLAEEGMEITTADAEILEARRMTLELMCGKHRMECEYCSRYMDCELHELMVDCGIDDRKYSSVYVAPDEDHSSPIFVRDNAKCIVCRRCEAVCAALGVRAIGAMGRGEATVIGSSVPMPESGCVECGLCVAACPTGALSFKSDVQKVWNLMRIGKKQMIAVVAPEVFEKLGEYLHLDESTDGRLSAFLRAMGFKRVYVMPEIGEGCCGQSGIYSVCPAVKKYINEHLPQYVDAISIGESPVKAAGELCRKDYCEALKSDADDTALVLITNCAPEKNADNGFDAVLTARELITLLNQGSVSKYTMLKMWRDVTPAGLDRIEVSTADSGTNRLKVYGLAELLALLENDKLREEGKSIEAYACPGGCSNGGGRLK